MLLLLNLSWYVDFYCHESGYSHTLTLPRQLKLYEQGGREAELCSYPDSITALSPSA